jgi:hypothetical protein
MTDSKHPTISELIASKCKPRACKASVIGNLDIQNYNIMEPFGCYVTETLYPRVEKELEESTRHYRVNIDICVHGNEEHAGNMKYKYPKARIFYGDPLETLKCEYECKSTLIIAPINTQRQLRMIRDMCINEHLQCKWVIMSRIPSIQLYFERWFKNRPGCYGMQTVTDENGRHIFVFSNIADLGLNEPQEEIRVRGGKGECKRVGNTNTDPVKSELDGKQC